MTGISAPLRPWAGFISITAVIGVVVAWGVGRGFDFTDEGVYYLSLAHPAEVSDFHTSYHLLARGLFALAGHNIALTRALIVALSVLAAAIFFHGLRRWSRSSTTRPLPAGSSVALGACIAASLGLAFASSPVAPSYNLLNAALLLAAAGLILSCAAEEAATPKSRARFFALAALAGGALAADFFVKFSTSVPLFLTGVFFLLIAGRAPRRQKLQLAALVLLTAALTASLFLLSVQDFARWKNGTAGLWSSLTSSSYLNSYLGRYRQEFIEELLSALWTYLPVLNALGLAAAALLVLRRWPRLQRWGAALAGLIVAGLFVAIACDEHVFTQIGFGRVSFYLTALIVSLSGFALSLIVAPRPAWNTREFGATTALLAGWCVLLPFLGSVGTTNDISTNLFYQLAPWLVVVVLALRGIDWCWRSVWATRLGATLLCAVALAQFFHGFIDAPYRLPGGLRAQTEPTLIGVPASTLRLDPATHAFVEAAQVQLISNGFKPGDDLFAFFNLPGLVFAVGGVSPGHPWYFAGDQSSLDADARRIAAVTPLRRAQAFIITNGNIAPFLPQLNQAGVNFPAGYVRCGEPLKNPLTQEPVEIWRPR